MKSSAVKSSAELPRDVKRWVFLGVACFILLQILQHFGFISSPINREDEALFWGVILVGILMIECTDVVLTAIKESSGSERPKAHPSSVWGRSSQ